MQHFSENLIAITSLKNQHQLSMTNDLGLPTFAQQNLQKFNGRHFGFTWTFCTSMLRTYRRMQNSEHFATHTLHHFAFVFMPHTVLTTEKADLHTDSTLSFASAVVWSSWLMSLMTMSGFICRDRTIVTGCIFWSACSKSLRLRESSISVICRTFNSDIACMCLKNMQLLFVQTNNWWSVISWE